MRDNTQAIDYASLAKRIAQARKANGLTQEKLAEAVSISQSFIAKFESRATNSIGLQTLVKACNCLNVSMDYLLADSLQIKAGTTDMEIQRLLTESTENDKQLVLACLQALRQYKDNIKNTI